LTDYGEAFIERIVAYCQANQVPVDVPPPAGAPAPIAAAKIPPTPGATAQTAFPLFRQGLSVEQIAQRLGRAPSTVRGYLGLFIQQERITDPSPWVDPATAERIVRAAGQVGTERLKPIFDLLGGQISYEQIRIVVLCLENAETF